MKIFRCQRSFIRNITPITAIPQAIDVSGESITLSLTRNVDAGEIAGLTPAANPRYHFFRYRHSFEDNTLEQIIFVYSCPMASKVKERMLYSSCKAAVQGVGVELGLEIAKSVRFQFVFLAGWASCQEQFDFLRHLLKNNSISERGQRCRRADRGVHL